jgi:hypothetical protein
LAGRSSYAAAKSFHDAIQLALSCVTRDVCVFRSHPQGYEILTFDEEAKLSGPWTMAMAIAYRAIEIQGNRGPWKISTAKYRYELFADNKSIVAYDWHPGRERDAPHLHVDCGIKSPYFHHKVHLPTGRVSLEEVLRMAIEDLDVKPRRSDWDAVLRRTQARYEKFRTWPGLASDRLV